MFLKQKLKSDVPDVISAEKSFCTNHFTRVWIKGVPDTLAHIEKDIRLMCRIEDDQKCVLTHYSSFPGTNWEISNRNEKFDKIVILSTHPVVDNTGKISLEGGEYIMISSEQKTLHFLPSAPNSSLLVFSYFTPSERRKKMDQDLDDLMS